MSESMNSHRTFTETEKAILRIVQRDLPDSLTPFADIANAVGTDEATVLSLLQSMKADGSIRRFGASVKHQKAGFTHNAMVAWKTDPALADAAGKAAAEHPRISHCYFRPSSAPDWPYTLFTMIHGRSEEECREVIDHLREHTTLRDYAVLNSLQELKKISMTYF